MELTAGFSDLSATEFELNRPLGLTEALTLSRPLAARIAGIQRIELQVRAINVTARHFYQRMGYTEEVLINNYYDGKEAAYQMKLRLTSR